MSETVFHLFQERDIVQLVTANQVIPTLLCCCTTRCCGPQISFVFIHCTWMGRRENPHAAPAPKCCGSTVIPAGRSAIRPFSCRSLLSFQTGDGTAPRPVDRAAVHRLVQTVPKGVQIYAFLHHRNLLRVIPGRNLPDGRSDATGVCTRFAPACLFPERLMHSLSGIL